MSFLEAAEQIIKREKRNAASRKTMKPPYRSPLSHHPQVAQLGEGTVTGQQNKKNKRN